MTAYAYLHGKEALETLAEFGERVLYYVPAKPRRNLDARWAPGVFLGRALNTNECYLGTEAGGVVRARSFNSVSDELRWNPQLIWGITGTPGKMREDPGDGFDRSKH